MAQPAERVHVTCTSCSREFSLPPYVYAKRKERYGDRMLCQACISDLWLWGRGRYLTERLTAGEGNVPQT